jgi:hypothetical protein
VEQLGELKIDLLATGEANEESAVAYATHLVRVRFSEQLGKASQDRPGSAELLLERGPAVVVRREIGSRPGWVVSATVRVTRQGRHPTQAHSEYWLRRTTRRVNVAAPGPPTAFAADSGQPIMSRRG